MSETSDPTKSAAAPHAPASASAYRRYVLGALLVLSLIQIAGALASPQSAAKIELWMWAESAVFHLLLIAGILVRGKRASIAVLAALIFFHLYSIPIY